MTQKTNPFAHDKRDNQRGQAEAMIEGKDQKHTLIAVNMDVLKQRKEWSKERKYAGLAGSFLIVAARTARQHADNSTSFYIRKGNADCRRLFFYALHQRFARYFRTGIGHRHSCIFGLIIDEKCERTGHQVDQLSASEVGVQQFHVNAQA